MESIAISKKEIAETKPFSLSKRIFDIVGSAFVFVCSLPLWPFIIILILIEDGFPIFVRLERISEGRVIKVIKFRSMIRGAHAMKKDLKQLNERHDGPLFKIAHDPRVLKTGRIIRKLRIDELPQLLNVLAGDLSLVGPRPHEPEEVVHYPEEFKMIPLARAGATGLTQVSGASSLPFERELELDRFYLSHRTLWIDIKILVKTVFIFLFDPTGV